MNFKTDEDFYTQTKSKYRCHVEKDYRSMKLRRQGCYQGAMILQFDGRDEALNQEETHPLSQSLAYWKKQEQRHGENSTKGYARTGLLADIYN